MSNRISTAHLLVVVRASGASIFGLLVMWATIVFGVVGINELRAEQANLLERSYKLDRTLRAFNSPNAYLNMRPILPGLVSSKILSVLANDMQALAQQNGLKISEVSYKPNDSVITPDFSRIEISVKFSGTYVSLKKFMAIMCSTYDSLALESIIMRRDRSTDLMLDIDLRWTLFYRK